MYVASKDDRLWLQNVQRKLHTRSWRNPDYQFRKLWGLITDPRNLRIALARVNRNRGRRTAGVDGMTVNVIWAEHRLVQTPAISNWLREVGVRHGGFFRDGDSGLRELFALDTEAGRSSEGFEVTIYFCPPDPDTVRRCADAGVDRVLFPCAPVARDEALAILDGFSSLQ